MPYTFPWGGWIYGYPHSYSPLNKPPHHLGNQMWVRCPCPINMGTGCLTIWRYFTTPSMLTKYHPNIDRHAALYGTGKKGGFTLTALPWIGLYALIGIWFEFIEKRHSALHPHFFYRNTTY